MTAAGRALFDGWIVVTAWPSADAARLLPAGVQLASVSGWGNGHPVAFVFGDVSSGAVVLGGMEASTGRPFRDFGVYVPCVLPMVDGCSHVHVAQVWSSYPVSRWSGNFHYGFPKSVGRMWWQDFVFLVTDDTGKLAAHAEVQPVGPWHAGSDCSLEHFDEVREMFSLPVLGHRPDGRPVRSRFDWDFAAAQVRGGDAAVSLDQPLPSGVGPHRAADVSGRSFEIRGLVWNVSWPT